MPSTDTENQELDELKQSFDNSLGEADVQSGITAAERHANSTGSLYKPGGKGRFGRLRGFMQQRKRAFVVVGILSALGIGGGLLPALIMPWQLLHLKENITDFFDEPSARSLRKRIGGHYKIIVDKDGTVQGHRKRGVLARYGNNTRENLVKDFESKGFKASYDARGNLQAFDLPDGSRMDVSELSAREQRRVVRDTVDSLYGDQKSSWRRGRMARQADRRFGIAKRAYYSRGSPVTNFKKKFRSLMFGNRENLSTRVDAKKTITEEVENPDGTTSTVTREIEIPEARKLADDFSDGIVKQAADLQADALANPDKVFHIDPAKILAESGDDVARAAAKGGVRSFFGSGLANAADAACRVKTLSKSVEVGAKIYRSRNLAKYAILLLAAADGIKTGDVDPEELNALMLFLMADSVDGDITKSGAWQFISGRKDAKLGQNSIDKYSYDDGGALGTLGQINKLAKDTGFARGCGIVTNPFFQIGAAVGSAFLTVGTWGGFEAVDVVVGVLGETLLSILENVAEPILVHMVAGMSVTGDEQPHEGVDAGISGYSAYSTTIERSYGFQPATNAQLEQETALIEREELEVANRRGFAYRWLSPKNPDSLVTKVGMQLPHSYSGMARRVGSHVASIFHPSELLKSFGSWLTSKNQVKAAPNDLAKDLFGRQQYIMPDELLDKYDVLENSEWIAKNNYIGSDNQPMGDLKAYADKCFLSENPDDYEDDDCRSSQEKYERFRVYWLDINLAQEVNDNINKTFAQ